jgi:beta-glucosidase
VPNHVYKLNDNKYNATFVNTPEEADLVLLWITPGAKSLFESDGSPIYLSLSKNGIDTGYINRLTAKKPTILAINYTNPWVIDEIYNQQTMHNIKGVLSTFNTTVDALLDVVTGKFNPTGKMPFTTPVSEAVVQQQLSDVPGYLKGATYPLFKYGEGLSYK